MKISLENIGKLKRANIEVGGITVIAGENDTGKSTIGRAMYSIFNSFYDLKNYINKNRVDMAKNQIRKTIIEVSGGLLKERALTNNIVSTIEGNIEILEGENLTKFQEVIYKSLNDIDDIDKKRTLSEEMILNLQIKLQEIFKISDEDIYKRI